MESTSPNWRNPCKIFISSVGIPRFRRLLLLLLLLIIIIVLPWLVSNVRIVPILFFPIQRIMAIARRHPAHINNLLDIVCEYSDFLRAHVQLANQVVFSSVFVQNNQRTFLLRSLTSCNQIVLLFFFFFFYH